MEKTWSKLVMFVAMVALFSSAAVSMVPAYADDDDDDKEKKGKKKHEVYTGDGPPNEKLGKNGDGYIDNESNDCDFYIKTGKKTWTFVQTLCAENTGPPGPPGPAGPGGNDGATGPAGADGQDGATGPAGADGQDGATGPAGADGQDGATGPAGADGQDGATGPAGADGQDGATGPAGAQGPQGETGETGSQGIQGIQGLIGPEGPIGPDGLPGPIGLTGPQGPPGNDGAAGADGATGATGAVGPQGPPGNDGAAGADGATGATGADGATGATGADGATGATGAVGPAGPPGPAGPTNPITGADIVDETVTGDDILDGSLTSFDILDNSLNGGDIGDGTLTGDDILDGTLTGADIVDETVTGDDILDGSLTSFDILDNSLNGGDIGDGTIQAIDLAPGVIPSGSSSFYILTDSFSGSSGAVYCDAGDFVTGGGGVPGTQTVTIDFDSVEDDSEFPITDPLNSNQIVNADNSPYYDRGAMVYNYLQQFGVTVVDEGTIPDTRGFDNNGNIVHRDFIIFDSLGFENGGTGGAPVYAIPESAPNGFMRDFGNEPYRYSLYFDVPLDSFSFTRTANEFGAGMAPWNAQAYDSNGNAIPGASTSQTGSPGSHVSHTLNGPDIAYVSFWRDSNNLTFGLAQVPLDNFILTYPGALLSSTPSINGGGDQGWGVSTLSDGDVYTICSDIDPPHVPGSLDFP